MKLIPEKELRELLKDVDGTYGLYGSLPDEGEKLEIFKRISRALYDSLVLC